MGMFSDLRAFRRDPLGLMGERGRAGEPLARLRLGPRPVYLVADPELARALLRADERDADKGRYVGKLRPVLGLNSLTLSGEAHRARRAAVHRALADSLADAAAAGIAADVGRWTLSLTAVEAVDAGPAAAHLALRLVCSMLFGRGALSAGDEAALVEAVRLVEADLAEDMFRLLPRAPWAALQRRRRRLHARAVMGRVVERTAARATRGGLVAGLRAAGLEGDALRDEILFLLLAGHHTTGSAAAWALWHQAADPALARALAEEAARLHREAGELTPAALRQAPISRAVVSEVLRLYPPSYWMSRELARDQPLGGRTLRRGTALIVAPWQLGRDPRHWAQPEAFRLDRGWAGNPAYMPFGVGGRACTGMAMATFMVQAILLQFAATFDGAAAPAAAPVPSVTLLPPPLRIRIAVRGSTADQMKGAAA